MMNEHILVSEIKIGIDLGGTKIELVALHGGNGRELYRHRVPTPNGDYDQTIDTLKDLVLQAEQTLGSTASVGMGIPGIVSRSTGLVKNCNATYIIGKALDKDLASALNRPIRIENDANCFALSEATDGAAAGAEVVFGVIIGTGCGGGVVVNQQVVRGVNLIGGEWGHNPMPWPVLASEDRSLGTEEWPGPACYCGRTGCIERFLSGPGFRDDYQRVTGLNHSTHDIIALANDGDAGASAALDRYCERLAKGLAHMINILDPNVIVLGGGMSNVDALYTEVPKRWGRYIFSDTIDTQLKPPRYGDSSGVRGAAHLWPTVAATATTLSAVPATDTADLQIESSDLSKAATR
jgi:fructokinase